MSGPNRDPYTLFVRFGGLVMATVGSNELGRRRWLRRLRTYDVVIALVVLAVLVGLIVPFAREAAVREVAAGGGVTGGGSGALTPVAGGSFGDGSAGTGGEPVGAGTGSGGPGTSAGGTGTGGGGPTGTTGGGAGGTPAPGAGAVAGGATDIGVTETEIHIGFGVMDIGIAREFGASFDIGNPQARFDALIAAVNEAGGIHGRRIVPHYRPIVVGRNETLQAACVGWTRDDRVFAVFVTTNFNQAATVCVIGEGNTPLFASDGLDESYYANNRFFSTQPSDNRILRDQVAYLVATGALEGRTIGVLSGDGPERAAIDNTLIPLLRQHGHEVATVEVVPATVEGTQRMSIAVSNLRAAGVDLVIVAANTVLLGPFVQTASRAGYEPEFAVSDFNQQINDQVADYFPDSFNGTVGLSTRRFPEYRAGQPLAPADQSCVDRVRGADPKVLPPTNSAFEVAMHECSVWDVFVAGATAAGPDLTRDTLAAGIETLGRFPLAGLQDGIFGPGRHDGGAFLRDVQWQVGCRCWMPVGPVREMR